MTVSILDDDDDTAGPTATPSKISLVGAPGETVKQTLTVEDNLAVDSLAASIGKLSQTQISAKSAEVTFSYTVPSDAQPNETFTGNITLEDGAGNTTTVPVAVAAEDTKKPEASDVAVEGVPGETAETTFEVQDDSPPITVSTDLEGGEVTPETINSPSGEVTFRFAVPDDAQIGDTFTGDITLTDAQGNESTLSVSVNTKLTFADELGDEGPGPSLAKACEDIAALEESERTPGQKDMLATCTKIQTADNPDELLDKIAPEEVAVQGRTVLGLLQQHQRSIYRRLTMLPRGGGSRGGGIDISGLNLNVAGQSVSGSVLQQAAKRVLGAGAGDMLDLGRFSAFVTGNFNILKRDASRNERGFDSSGWDITAGGDYRFSDDFFLGAALGYANSGSDVNGDAGELDTSAITTTLYSKYYFPKSAYVSGALTYSHSELDSTRDVTLGAAQQLARGDTSGNQFGLNLNGGYDLAYKALTVALQGRLQYFYTRIGGYNEKASNPGALGSGALLSIDDQTIDSLLTELAAQLTYAIKAGSGVVSPTLRVGWEHQYLNDQRFINARFLNDPSRRRFSVRTDEPDRNYFNIGAGASAVFPHGRSAFVFVESVEGRSDTRYYTFTAGVRLEF